MSRAVTHQSDGNEGGAKSPFWAPSQQQDTDDLEPKESTHRWTADRVSSHLLQGLECEALAVHQHVTAAGCVEAPPPRCAMRVEDGHPRRNELRAATV